MGGVVIGLLNKGVGGGLFMRGKVYSPVDL